MKSIQGGIEVMHVKWDTLNWNGVITKMIKRAPWAALGQAEAKMERMYTSVSRDGLIKESGPLKAMTRASRVLEVKASSWPGVAASAA